MIQQVEQVRLFLESQITDSSVLLSGKNCFSILKQANSLVNGALQTIFEERMHAESEINVYTQTLLQRIVKQNYPNELEYYDPEITQLGIDQCKKLSQSLNEELHEEIGFADLVFVSPLQRAILTFNQISGAATFKDIKTVYLTQVVNHFQFKLIREGSGKMAGNCGRKKSALLSSPHTQNQTFNFDLTYLNKEKWWREFTDQTENGPNQVEYLKKESQDEIAARICLLLLYCAIREEKRIFWVSHGIIYDCFDGFPLLSKAYNCACKVITKEQYMRLATKYF